MKLIKVPSNAGALAKKDGIEKAPDAICERLPGFFLKENGLLPFLEIGSMKVDNADIGKTNKEIEKEVSELMGPAILVGGDHSITYPAFKAFSRKSKNCGLIIFDAHLDCENDFSPPTHEDFVRMLISEGHLKKENIAIVGIRNFHANEHDFWKKNKLKVYDMKEIAREGISEVCDSVMSVAKNFDSVYISIDIDVLDPAFAPGTGYCEPGGLTTRELLSFVQRLKNLKNIGMWDLVEVNPKKDLNGITCSTAAKLITEMC